MAYCNYCSQKLDSHSNCSYCDEAYALYKMGYSKLYNENNPEEAYQYFKKIVEEYENAEKYKDALYQIKRIGEKDVSPELKEEKDELLKNAKAFEESQSPSQVNNSTTWISILDTCANITIALGIIASIVIGISIMSMEELVLVGLIIMAIGCLLSVVSAAGIKTLIGVAKDIHFIRNKAETNSNDINGK